MVDKLAEVFGSAGLRTARQKYEYSSSGQTTAGENIYSVLHAPRGDATEAIVLAAPWNNTNGEINRSGVALLLTLARYFKRMCNVGTDYRKLADVYNRLVFVVQGYHILSYK